MINCIPEKTVLFFIDFELRVQQFNPTDFLMHTEIALFFFKANVYLLFQTVFINSNFPST